MVMFYRTTCNICLLSLFAKGKKHFSNIIMSKANVLFHALCFFRLWNSTGWVVHTRTTDIHNYIQGIGPPVIGKWLHVYSYQSCVLHWNIIYQELHFSNCYVAKLLPRDKAPLPSHANIFT